MFENWVMMFFKLAGNGYVENLQYFISECYANDQNQVILTITADMPLINSETIDQVIIEYERCGKRAMCIAVPVDYFEAWFEAQYGTVEMCSLGIKYIKK